MDDCKGGHQVPNSMSLIMSEFFTGFGKITGGKSSIYCLR